MGDQVVSHLRLHDCWQSPANFVVLGRKHPVLGQQLTQGVEAVRPLPDQRSIGGAQHVVRIGLVVDIQYRAARRVLRHVREVEAAIGLGQRGHRFTLCCAHLPLGHSRGDLAERKVPLLQRPLVPGAQQFKLDAVHRVTDFGVALPLDAVLGQPLDASEALLLGNSRPSLVEGHVVLEPTAHILEAAPSNVAQSVELVDVLDQPAVHHGEQRDVAQIS